MNAGEPVGRGGRGTGVLLVVAVVVAAALVPWLGAGVVGAASCTTVSGGTTIDQSGCYVLDGSQSDGDEEDSDVSRFVEVNASDVVLDGNGNTIDGTGTGEAVYVDGAYSNVTVRNVTVTDWSTGVYVRGADDVLVEDLAAGSNAVGVRIEGTTNATVRRVNASDNANHGVYLLDAPGGVVANVTADRNGESNVRVATSDGATVGDVTVAGGGRHGILLSGSTNASLVRVVAENASTDGIRVERSGNATLRDSTARRAGQYGFHVLDSSANVTVRNVIAANNTQHGARIYRSNGSTVAASTARDNGGAGVRVSSRNATIRDNRLERNAVGVYLYTYDHTVVNNTVRANGYGITLDADGNTIAHNRVVGSTTAGFHYRSGKDALIYDNLFNNSKNTEYSTDPAPSNRWNVTPRTGTNVLGGSVVGGNAWFDPAGDGHSELWNDSDADGFVDANYTVNKTSVDEYPLNAVDSALTVTPASHDYGSLNLTETATKRFVVESRARPNITVDRLSVEGLDALMFTLESDPTPVALSTGETVAVNVTFDPTVTGLLTANLSAESDTTGVAGVNATLSGEGVDDTAPTAEAGPNQTVDDGTSVAFDGTNSTDDVGIVSYGWDFGDGNTTTGATPNYTYSAPGTYTVTLNVSDDAGNTDTDITAVTVSDVTAPTADAGANQSVEEDTSVSFDGTNSTDDVGIVSYEWVFGDGNTSTGATTNHTYSTPGTYTVRLNVSDDAGNTDTDTLTVDVTDVTAPVAEAGPNQTVDDSSPVSFDGTNSTDDVGIVSYEWDFGDGNTTTGATPNHTYSAPGTYTVTLNVSDDADNTDTDTLTVDVGDVTAPTAEAGPNRTVDEDDSITLDGTDSTDNVGVVSYEWDLGDGNTTTGATPTHTYTAPGTYTVRLNVSDDAGNTDTDTATVTVSDVTAPIAKAGPNRTVDDGTAVTLDGTNSTDNAGVVSYEWDLGDGNTSTGATTNHTYSAPGTYTVTLNASDAAGNTDTDTLVITVESADTADGGDGGGGAGGGSGGGGAMDDDPTGEVTITERVLLNGTAAVGEPVVVRVGLANYDPVRGLLALDLTANGVVVAEREVAVGADGERTVYLGTTFDQPGRYALEVNGATAGTVEVVSDASGNETDEGSTPVSPPPEDLEVVIETRDGSSADVTVRGVESNRSVPVEFGDDDPSTGEVSFESISFTPTADEPITMNVAASRDPLPGAPEFDRTDNTSGLAHLRVEHSIANADVDGAVVRFRVSAARLERLEVAPDEVALYRYQDGSWAELPTRVLRETDDGYVFAARSPGLSEFAAGAKQPQFELRTAEVAVDRIQVGDEVRVRVRITNTGGADGTYTAKLLLNEAVVSERRLTIAANGTRQVLFSHEIGRAGDYRVLVNGFPAGNVSVSNGVAGNGTVAVDRPIAGALGGTSVALVGALSVLFAAGLFVVRRRDRD